MRALTVSDKDNMIMALQDEIRRNDASRYDHRLHGVLLVAQGLTCPQVAGLLGDSARTVVNWLQRFETQGLAGLAEGERTGRPSRLKEEQLTKGGGGIARQPQPIRPSSADVGRPDVVRISPASIRREAKGATVSAVVPSTRLSAAQATAASRSSRSPAPKRA
jgi:hypothetical protein